MVDTIAQTYSGLTKPIFDTQKGRRMLLWLLKDGVLCILNMNSTMVSQFFKRLTDKDYSYTNNMHVCIILTNCKLQFPYLFCFMFSQSFLFPLSLTCSHRLSSVPTVPRLSSVCSFYSHKHCQAHSGKSLGIVGQFGASPGSPDSDWSSQLVFCVQLQM